jgi:hypothetical protein
MSDFIVKLDPEDEFNHIPDSSSNYNESMYSMFLITIKKWEDGLGWAIDLMRATLK